MSIKVQLNPFSGTRDLWLETKIHSLRIKCLTTDIVRLTIRVSVSVSKIRSGQWCCELRRIYNASQGKQKQTKVDAFLKMFHAFLHFILFQCFLWNHTAHTGRMFTKIQHIINDGKIHLLRKFEPIPINNKNLESCHRETWEAKYSASSCAQLKIFCFVST